MNDWRPRYQHKLVSAEQALQAVKSGDRVVFGHACSEPPVLVQALVARAPELSNVEIVHMVPMGPAAFAQPGMERSFRFNGPFLGAPTRKAVQENRGTFTPCFFSEVPRLFKRKILPVDVMLLQVTPPDEQGFCSYGLSADYTQAAAESAQHCHRTDEHEVSPHCRSQDSSRCPDLDRGVRFSHGGAANPRSLVRSSARSASTLPR